MSSVEHTRMSSSSSIDESPKTKLSSSGSSSKLSKGRDSAVGEGPPSTSRFAGPGVDFKGKLIGMEDVAESRGDKMCQIAMAKLKAGVKAAREHKQRIVINVNLDGINIVDEKSSEVLHVHEVNRISFISRDTGDSRAFGYVYRRAENSHQFVGIKTEKAAEGLVLSLRDLFQAAFEMKKKEEAEKQEAEAGSNDVNSDVSGVETAEAGDEPSTVKSEEKSDEKSEKEEKSTTAENLLNFEIEFQNLSKASTAPISPIWTTVDPWRQGGQAQQPVTTVGVAVLPLQYPGTATMSPYGFAAAFPPAAVLPPGGPSPFNATPWPPPPPPTSHQIPAGVDPFLANSLSPQSHPNGSVFRPSEDALMPAVLPLAGNPFTAAAAAPTPPPQQSTAGPETTHDDPFAKLASGLLGATPQPQRPGRKTDKSDFFAPEPPKPTLLHLSQQQQQEQGSDVQQENVDLFGATPFSTALTAVGSANDNPFQ